jgi:hypothetical protein
MSRSCYVVLTLTLLAGAASAEEFQIYGPRAMGMGGAGTAVAEGGTAQYWNPAGLAQSDNVSGLQVPIGVHAQFDGSVVTGANDLFNVVQACNNGDPKCSSANINAALNELNQPGNGLLTGISAGVNAKVGAFTLGVVNESEVGASPVIDLANTNPCPSPGAGCVQNNQSNLQIEAGVFTAVALSYAHHFFVPGLMLGGSVKAVDGAIGFKQFFVAQDKAGSSDAFKDVNKSAKNSVQPAFDLGVLWDVSQAFPLPLHPKVGLVGRNLNSPQFDAPDTAVAAGLSSKVTLDRQVRAGVELSPFHWWHLAADMDLTKNSTLLRGGTSRLVGVGTEIDVFNRSWINIPLRVGVAKDTSASGLGTLYTAGLGLNFLHVIFDVGGQISSSKVDIGNGDSAPTAASASAQLGIMF